MAEELLGGVPPVEDGAGGGATPSAHSIFQQPQGSGKNLQEARALDGAPSGLCDLRLPAPPLCLLCPVGVT